MRGPVIPPGGYPRIVFHNGIDTMETGFGLSREEAREAVAAMLAFHPALGDDYDQTWHTDMVTLGL
jgi:hypothetical protein